MQLGGAGGLLLTTLMARWGGQASIPGGFLGTSNEFRAARVAAETCSAQLVLGENRPSFNVWMVIFCIFHTTWQVVDWSPESSLHASEWCAGCPPDRFAKFKAACSFAEGCSEDRPCLQCLDDHVVNRTAQPSKWMFTTFALSESTDILVAL